MGSTPASSITSKTSFSTTKEELDRTTAAGLSRARQRDLQTTEDRIVMFGLWELAHK